MTQVKSRAQREREAVDQSIAPLMVEIKKTVKREYDALLKASFITGGGYDQFEQAAESVLRGYMEDRLSHKFDVQRASVLKEALVIPEIADEAQHAVQMKAIDIAADAVDSEISGMATNAMEHIFAETGPVRRRSSESFAQMAAILGTGRSATGSGFQTR